jgi:hypothetical protein
MKKTIFLMTVIVTVLLSACNSATNSNSHLNSDVVFSSEAFENHNEYNASSIFPNNNSEVTPQDNIPTASDQAPQNNDEVSSDSTVVESPSSQGAPTPAAPQTLKSQIDSVNISLSPAPIEVSYRTKNHIYSTAIINSYTITKTDTANNRVLCQVDFNCTKTFDEDGENGSNGCQFKLIIRKDNVIVGTECVYSDLHISVNQVFTAHWEATFTPGNNYTVELCDYLI